LVSQQFADRLHASGRLGFKRRSLTHELLRASESRRRRSSGAPTYRDWIAEYAGAPYQKVALNARNQLERLAACYAAPAREAELMAIFKEATRLEERLLGDGLARGWTW
jgi:thiaminase